MPSHVLRMFLWVDSLQIGEAPKTFGSESGQQSGGSPRNKTKLAEACLTSFGGFVNRGGGWSIEAGRWPCRAPHGMSVA